MEDQALEVVLRIHKCKYCAPGSKDNVCLVCGYKWSPIPVPHVMYIRANGARITSHDDLPRNAYIVDDNLNIDLDWPSPPRLPRRSYDINKLRNPTFTPTSSEFADQFPDSPLPSSVSTGLAEQDAEDSDLDLNWSNMAETSESGNDVEQHTSISRTTRKMDRKTPKLPERIPMTREMLQAYALMHGNKDKAVVNYGPLHHALYTKPDRQDPDDMFANLPLGKLVGHPREDEPVPPILYFDPVAQPVKTSIEVYEEARLANSHTRGGKSRGAKQAQVNKTPSGNDHSMYDSSPARHHGPVGPQPVKVGAPLDLYSTAAASASYLPYAPMQQYENISSHGQGMGGASEMYNRGSVGIQSYQPKTYGTYQLDPNVTTFSPRGNKSGGKLSFSPENRGIYRGQAQGFDPAASMYAQPASYNPSRPHDKKGKGKGKLLSYREHIANHMAEFEANRKKNRRPIIEDDGETLDEYLAKLGPEAAQVGDDSDGEDLVTWMDKITSITPPPIGDDGRNGASMLEYLQKLNTISSQGKPKAKGPDGKSVTAEFDDFMAKLGDIQAGLKATNLNDAASTSTGYQSAKSRSAAASKKSSDTTENTYADQLAKNPPKSKSQGYKGDESYASYGYTNVNNKWVDPESTKEITEALLTKAERGRPRSPKGLKSIIGTGGPRIMSQEEQDEFYPALAAEMADDEDSGYDPRDLAITPATFALLAQGAASGDAYVKVPTPKQDRVVRRPSSVSPGIRRAAQHDRTAQYDEETGSEMTGYYEQDSDSPSIVISAEGVDLSSRPESFNMMAPIESESMNHMQFGTRERHKATTEWLYRPREPELGTTHIYSSVAAREEFKSAEDPTGAMTWETNKAHIQSLRECDHVSLLTNLARFNHTEQAGDRLKALRRDVYFMQNLLNPVTRYASPTYNPKIFSPTSPKPIVAAPAGQYARYVDEERQRHLIGIQRTAQTNELLEDDFAAVQRELAEVEVLHRDLKLQLGIHWDSDIAQLWAAKEGSSEGDS